MNWKEIKQCGWTKFLLGVLMSLALVAFVNAAEAQQQVNVTLAWDANTDMKAAT